MLGTQVRVPFGVYWEWSNMIPMNTELVRASLEMQHSQIFQRSIFLVPQSGKWRTLYLTVLHVLAPPMVDWLLQWQKMGQIPQAACKYPLITCWKLFIVFPGKILARWLMVNKINRSFLLEAPWIYLCHGRFIRLDGSLILHLTLCDECSWDNISQVWEGGWSGISNVAL